MSDPAQPSGSRVTAPPPELSEAMKQALAALQAVVDNSLCERCDPNGELLIRASDARRPLEAALAVSPGCRGAELEALAANFKREADAADELAKRHGVGNLELDTQYRTEARTWRSAARHVEAFRASGEAGPDRIEVFEEVMDFLNEQGYMPRDSDGNCAYRGGHRQEELAELFARRMPGGVVG